VNQQGLRVLQFGDQPRLLVSHLVKLAHHARFSTAARSRWLRSRPVEGTPISLRTGDLFDLHHRNQFLLRSDGKRNPAGTRGFRSAPGGGQRSLPGGVFRRRRNDQSCSGWPSTMRGMHSRGANSLSNRSRSGRHRFFALRAGQFAQQIESHGVVGEQSPLSSGGRAGAAFGSLERHLRLRWRGRAEVIQAQRHSFRWAAQELRQLLQWAALSGSTPVSRRTSFELDSRKVGQPWRDLRPIAGVIAPAGQPSGDSR